MNQIKQLRSQLQKGKKIFHSKESSIHEQVAKYLKLQYPKILFRTDFAAGMKMSIGQAKKHKDLQQGRSWPDLQVVAARKGYYGLFIELKRDGTRIFKRDKSFATDHIREQNECMELLRSQGYSAQFAIGFEEAKKIIDEYLR